MQTETQDTGTDLAAAETIDAKVVEESPPSGVPAAPPKRRGWIGAFFGGAVAAIFGFALAQYVPNGWPFAAISDLSAHVSAQQVQIAALQSELAKIPLKATTDPTVLDRIAALESQSAPDVSQIENRLIDLQSRLTAIELTPTDGSAASIAALKTEVQDLRNAGMVGGAELAAATEAGLQEAQKAAAAVTANAEQLAKTARNLAAFGQLQMAYDTGAAFAGALTELASEIDPIPAVLSVNAATGLPTLNVLKADFPAAARLALDAALRNQLGQSWSERATNFLRSQTGARSLNPREGLDPDAILSRAEAALNAADLKTVLTELDALPPDAQPALAAWRAKAETRIAANDAIAVIAAKLGE